MLFSLVKWIFRQFVVADERDVIDACSVPVSFVTDSWMQMYDDDDDVDDDDDDDDDE